MNQGARKRYTVPISNKTPAVLLTQKQVNVGHIIRLTCLCVALLLLYGDCCSTCFGQLVKFIYSILNRSFTNGITEEISSATEIDQSSSKTF